MTSDPDPTATQEWLDALDSVLAFEGAERASFLLDELIARHARAAARRFRTRPPRRTSTRSRSTAAAAPGGPGDRAPHPVADPLERGGDGAAGEQGVLRARRAHREFQSAATLYDIGFQHFWHAPSATATAATWCSSRGTPRPGIYARSFLEGRLSEEQLLKFRQEVGGGGLSSYPHPWLMPDYWQFPTVSMGLGPLMAIYQARFLKYLHAAGWPTRRTATCGRSSATARPTSPSRWARSRWPAGRSSTT